VARRSFAFAPTPTTTLPGREIAPSRIGESDYRALLPLWESPLCFPSAASLPYGCCCPLRARLDGKPDAPALLSSLSGRDLNSYATLLGNRVLCLPDVVQTATLRRSVGISRLRVFHMSVAYSSVASER